MTEAAFTVRRNAVAVCLLLVVSVLFSPLISLALALSPQPGNLITENHCYNQGTPSSGALYPDEGSAYMTWQDNVVSHIGASKWA